MPIWGNSACVMEGAAHISTENFMAGIIAFDQLGRPHARIERLFSPIARFGCK